MAILPIWTPKLVNMTTSLEGSENEGQIGHVQSFLPFGAFNMSLSKRTTV